MIKLLDIFLQHTLYINCYYCLVGMDAQIGCVAKDEEPVECFEGDAEAADDFDEDCDNSVDVEDNVAEANVVAFVADRNLVLQLSIHC